MGITKEPNGKYRARFTKKGVRHNVGVFETKKEAEKELAIARGYITEDPVTEQEIEEILLDDETVFTDDSKASVWYNNKTTEEIQESINKRLIPFSSKVSLWWGRFVRFIDIRKK